MTDLLAMVGLLAHLWSRDAALVTCVIEHESGWDVAAVGRHGELGIVQWKASSMAWALSKRGIVYAGDARLDPYMSIDTMLWAWSQGLEGWWTPYASCAAEVAMEHEQPYDADWGAR